MDQVQFDKLIMAIKEGVRSERWRPEADALLSDLYLDLNDDEIDQCVLSIDWHASTYDGSHMINVYKCNVSGEDLWLAVSCGDGGVAGFLDGPAKTFATLVKKMKVPEGWTFL